jgi:hypothetical protein
MAAFALARGQYWGGVGLDKPDRHVPWECARWLTSQTQLRASGIAHRRTDEEREEAFLLGVDDDGGGSRDVRAADLKEEMAEHVFPFRQIRRRRRQPSEHRCERQRAIR